MSRTVYVNGAYLSEDEATVSIFDRAFLFADGVYEVTAVVDGGLVDFDAHIARLHRSLDEMEMASPLSDSDFAAMHKELISRNGLTEGIVYMQVTRGAAERDFAFPDQATPTLIAFTQVKSLTNSELAQTGVNVVTLPDIRWKRRDIKSTALLAQALTKELAKQQGAFEGWMVEDGFITEGTSSSAFIVQDDRKIVTRPLSNAILPGVTRRAVLMLAKTADVTVDERLFSVEEAKAAREAFLTSASSFVLPVVEIDGARIGDGKPGPVTDLFRKLYLDEARRGELEKQ